jgi:hypothetical protein
MILASFVFMRKKFFVFYATNPSGYLIGHTLAPYVVLPTTNGQATGSEFWVQPAGIGGMKFIQPVQLAF